MAVELDTDGNGAIDIEKGGTNATSAVQALSNLGGQPFDADLTTLSSGTYAQKRALIEAFAKPVLGVDALRTTMSDFDGDCRYLAYHTASGDGGHGTFCWDAASAEEDDGQDTIAVTGVSTGRWKRNIDPITDELLTHINRTTAQALSDAKFYADNQFVTQVLHQEDLNNLQSQLDGQVIAWFYDYAPTLSNAPASLWTTEALRDQHANDTFTRLDTGQSWRWVYDGGVWKWVEIMDTATTAALSLAAQAQDTADGKRRVFVTQPTVPYDVGDLWTSGTTLKRCATAKTSAGSFAEGDWVAVADKTDYANTETFPAVVTPTTMKRTGSTFEKVGTTTAWDAQAYSPQRYAGGCRLAFKTGTPNKSFMMGFALDPTLSVAYTSTDYQFYLKSDATVVVYEKTTQVNIGSPTFTTDTLFEIIYDGSAVHYLMDGVVVRTAPGLDFNLSFCLDSSFYSAGSKATHVQWGPYSPTFAVVEARATVAETTAKAYANDEVTAAEQRAIADAQSKALMGHNLLNWYESWVPGTGSTGQFLRISTDAENMRALAVGPFGQREIVWQSIPSGDGAADGGFNTLAPTGGFSVDPDKTYIYGCYMQRLTGNGTLYFGCSTVKNLSDVVNSNPYFVSTNSLNDAKWMLAIGVLHPRGYTGSSTGLSGIYDVETGAKLVAGSDFKIDDTLADPTVQRMRAFQLYSTTGDGVTVEAQFARPFVMEASVCPPIDQLTGKLSTIASGADVTDYTTIYANTETFPAVLTPDVMKRTGSTFEKVDGVTGWNAQAYSLQGYTGGCRLAFKSGSPTLYFMAGINTDPATDTLYTSVDYQFHLRADGTVGVYEGSNSYVVGNPPYTTNTLFEIIYNGSEIRYLIDGVAVRTVTGLESGLTFYMDLSFAAVGSKATHVQWGPYAPPLSVVKALALAAETEAKSFADGIVTIEEQRAIQDAQAKANAAQAAAEGNSETFPAAITPDLMVRRGSTFERVAGSVGWLSQAYSANKYTGGCRVAFRAGSVDKAMALGINADPTLNTSYTSIDYCFYLQSNATVAVYESGTARAIGTPSYTTSTLFEIIYDGAEVRYLMDGVVVRTVSGLANNLTFYMDSSFYITGGKVTHVEWGPYGPTLSVTQILASTAEANAKNYADGQFVTKVLHTTDISNLQSQVDGQVSAWFYSYAPTTANAPASSWTTVALKEQHADDTFTRLDTGQSWRWVNTAGVWGWTEIADTATVTALAAAAQAQDTADNKRRVFVATPTVPYDIGDLWTTGSTISRCVTAKTTAGSYAAGDWVAVADATDYLTIYDTAQGYAETAQTQAEANAKAYADGQFVTQVIHRTDINNLQDQLDGQVMAWFYSYAPTTLNAPANLWTTEALKDQHANDTFTRLDTGQSWRWVYTAGVWGWTEIADTATTAALAAAAKAQDTADNKRRVFVATPTVPYDVGDLWTSSSTLFRCVVAKTTTGSYVAADWVAVADATDYPNTETFPAAITPDLMVRRGSTFEKVAGVSAWNTAQVYSLQKYTGGCRVVFRGGLVNTAVMLGINTDPTFNADHSSIDYCFYLQAGGTVAIYESGSPRNIGTHLYTTNTIFEIVYDGAEVRYLMDGVVVRTVTGLANSLTFYMDSSFYSVGAKITHVQWGPYGPTLSVAQTLASNAETNAKNYADGNFVTQLLHRTDISNLQSQLDGQVIAWFYSYAPTTANAPANLWTTEALKDQHANDTFTHLITGQSWRWVYDAGAWKWLEIADTATTAALAAAAQAQDTADSKRRVFVATPTVPYDIGDLWTTGSTISRCVTAKTAVDSYAIGDWATVADTTDYLNTETFPAAITPGLMLRRGSSFERVTGSVGWLSQAYSANKYTGGCRVAFRAGSVDKAVALGINTDPTLDVAYSSIDYCFFLEGNATVIIYESGTARAIGTPSYTTNTLFEITYDGAEVRYLMDGVAVRTVSGLANNLTFYMDSSFQTVGGKVTHVEWGPYGPTLSVTQTLASTAEANAKSYADGNFVTQLLHRTDISNLQSQLDGQVIAWFYSYAPTTANAPANLWTTEALKDQHANDTFTHLITGQSWRWVYDAGAWKWLEIADTATTAALAAAAQAQDTADSKRRVFVATPTVPYDIGDLWTTGSTISRCVTAKTTAGSYAAGDWVAVADATNYDDYRVSNVKTENNVTTIARPVGGTYYNSGASVTGAIKITLPQSWSNTMIKFVVDIRQFNTTKSFTLQLGGYNYITGSTWLNSFAQLTGSTASNNRVRFGHDGTKCCILIGDVTSVWNFPSVVVKDFQASFGNYTRDKWETGWVISLVTDISGITTTADIADTLIDAKSILGQGALATQNTADYGTQVTGTKPPANADSTTTVIGAGLITTGYIGNKGKTDPLLTLGINFDTAEILVGAAAGLKVKSGGGILVEGGGGITVKDNGSLSLEAGGDLILTADGTNPSKILFKRSPTDTYPITVSGSVDTDQYAGLSIMPAGPNISVIDIGEKLRRFSWISIAARGVSINVAPSGCRSIGFAADNEYGTCYGYAEIQAEATGIYGRCTCTTVDQIGVAKLESSDSTSVTSETEVTISAPDITITGSTVKGVPIYAPYRTTAPTTAELPNNHYIIYRISDSGIRLSMNCDGSIQTRSIL